MVLDLSKHQYLLIFGKIFSRILIFLHKSPHNVITTAIGTALFNCFCPQIFAEPARVDQKLLFKNTFIRIFQLLFLINLGPKNFTSYGFLFTSKL